MKQNIFDGLDELKSGERFSELLRRQDVVIERIQSSGDVDHGLYDQNHDEWVILLEGSATLEVSGRALQLNPGDHVFLPAHTRHRVLHTLPSPHCIWLAVHIGAEAQQADYTTRGQL